MITADSTPLKGHPVCSLWTGELTDMERMCMLSFIKQGHDFHLFTYGEVPGAPEEVEIFNANIILPERKGDRRIHAHIADHFRYELLYRCGGWWVDMDVICLRPWCFGEYPYVFPLEEKPSRCNNAVMKAPKASTIMAHAAMICDTVKDEFIPYPYTGPEVITTLIQTHGLQDAVFPTVTFMPIPWNRHMLYVQTPAPEISEDTCGLHLWHKMWKEMGMDPNATYPHDSIYQQLKKELL